VLSRHIDEFRGGRLGVGDHWHLRIWPPLFAICPAQICAGYAWVGVRQLPIQRRHVAGSSEHWPSYCTGLCHGRGYRYVHVSEALGSESCRLACRTGPVDCRLDCAGVTWPLDRRCRGGVGIHRFRSAGPFTYLKDHAHLHGGLCNPVVDAIGEKIISYLPFIGTVEEENVVFRQRLIDASIDIIAANPLFGSYDFMLYLEDLRAGGIIDIVNSYLNITLSSGLVGLSLFVSFFGVILIGIFKGMRASTRTMNCICSAAC